MILTIITLELQEVEVEAEQKQILETATKITLEILVNFKKRFI
jgi:hypothetical protein